MTPIRRLLNIIQFDLAEKLNLARLRWYHLNHQDQYLQSVIYGNPDNCTFKDLNKVFKTLEEYDDWWHQFKKKNPDAFRKDAKYVKSINGLFLIQKRLYQIPNRSLS